MQRVPPNRRKPCAESAGEEEGRQYNECMKKNKRMIQRIAALVLAGGLSFSFPDVTAEEEDRDYTDLQWHYNSETGVSFPGWNTYDETGAPVPNVDPSKEIVVAVVDSGVDYTHEDLKNVMWDKGLEYPELTALGGGKYGISTLPWGDSSDPFDDLGHGTHVSGIIAAEWNHIGVSGALSGVKIMAVKATGGNTMPIIKGLEYVLAAKRAGVNVAAVNLSWNGGIEYSGPELFNKVVKELEEENIVLVISAGNDHINQDNDMYMSTFRRPSPNVIITAASEESGDMASFSNYGQRYCDIIVPGNEILSTIPDLPQQEETKVSEANEEEFGEEEDIPFADKYYGYKSGTSMAAPIVTAEAAYLYSLYSDLSAGERAAHVVSSSKLKSSYTGLLYGGFADVTNAASLTGWPYVSDTEYDYRTELLTVYGYDFGDDLGKIQIDKKEYLPEYWSDRKITVKIRHLAMGEHEITIANRSASKSRWMNIAAENEDLTAVSFDVFPVIPSAMTLAGDEIHIAADQNDDGSEAGFYRLKQGASAFEKIGETEYFSPESAAVWKGRITYAKDRTLVMVEPDGKKPEKSELTFPQEYVRNVRVFAADDRLFAAWMGEDSFWIGECDFDTKTVTPLFELPSEGIRCIGLAEEENVIMAALLDESDYEQLHIDVIRFAIGEDSPETLFTLNAPDVDAYDHVQAVFVKERMYLGGMAEHDADNSWSYHLLEYTLEGEETMNEVLGGGHLHRFSMAAGKEDLVMFGSADAWKNSIFLLKQKISDSPSPTPTIRPYPTPSPKPDPDDEPERDQTPAPYYFITCQDAGYPEGWYWDETRHACIAPAPGVTPPPSSYGGTPAAPSAAPSSSDKPAASFTPDAPALTPDPSGQNEKEPTPQAGITNPASSQSPEPPAGEKKEPAKRSLSVLVQPAAMIIAGLLIALTRNRKAIPWFLAADALIGVLAAVLDHSVLSWLLLVFNLAAVGLLGLYKNTAKQN